MLMDFDTLGVVSYLLSGVIPLLAYIWHPYSFLYEIT